MLGREGRLEVFPSLSSSETYFASSLLFFLKRLMKFFCPALSFRLREPLSEPCFSLSVTSYTSLGDAGTKDPSMKRDPPSCACVARNCAAVGLLMESTFGPGVGNSEEGERPGFACCNWNVTRLSPGPSTETGTVIAMSECVTVDDGVWCGVGEEDGVAL